MSLSDCLAVGPIASGRMDERLEWLNHTMPNQLDWAWVAESVDQFRQRVGASELAPLVWVAPASACEQCGVQWYFEQFPEAPPGPMVIADQPLSRGWLNSPPIGLGELPEDLMAGLLDNAPRREWPADRASPQLWRRLREEGSLLRVVEDGDLRSVAPDFFDTLLLQQAPPEWTSWSRVVGGTMVAAGEQGHNIGDPYLVWRVRELVRAGDLECRGELPGRRHDREHRPDAMLRRVA